MISLFSPALLAYPCLVLSLLLLISPIFVLLLFLFFLFFCGIFLFFISAHQMSNTFGQPKTLGFFMQTLSNKCNKYIQRVPLYTPTPCWLILALCSPFCSEFLRSLSCFFMQTLSNKYKKRSSKGTPLDSHPCNYKPIIINSPAALLACQLLGTDFSPQAAADHSESSRK